MLDRQGSLQGFESAALCLQSDVRVVIQHFPADVTGDSHDGLIAVATFGQLGDRLVAQVMEEQVDMRSNGIRTDAELRSRELPIGTPHQQRKHLSFSGCELRSKQGRLLLLLSRPPVRGESMREHEMAIHGGPHGIHELRHRRG